MSKLNWSSSLEELYKSKPTKTAQKLIDSGYSKISQLLWILPLRVQRLPTFNAFTMAEDQLLFRGQGKILSVRSTPNFKARGKNRAVLMNLTVVVQDAFSPNTMELKWFNCYGSIVKKIEKINYISFLGTVQLFQEKKQVINPDFEEVDEVDLLSTIPTIDEKELELKRHYPTVQGLGGHLIQKVIDKIPKKLWDEIPDLVPSDILEKRNFITLGQAFKTLHGIDNSWTSEAQEEAKSRLIYEEFFDEQLKIQVRKVERQKLEAIIINPSETDVNNYKSVFPYDLTEDQDKAIDDIIKDCSSGSPMNRLVQGDVGCGKTSVALISALIFNSCDYQSALMCPTESLALQHYMGLTKEAGHLVRIELLRGSNTPKEKREILARLEAGEIDLIIGTHALFQDSVKFKKLGLVIVDEQHKFGVDQRIRLVSKGEGVHCLLMTATPIPRSLSLTQYGDLDLSIIKTMPGGRKGQKTRIVSNSTFPQFLSFMNTRLSMKEQAYVVVPAIEESEEQDIHNLEQVLERFKKFFPNYRVVGLHGKLKSEEKNEIFKAFKAHEIDILVSTSVIEVGINVINSTIMAILNPERFGLSSLHQLRGRVGRGEKPGFCFLVVDSEIGADSMRRLKVIEKHTDGFKIAEEDLEIRGQGDLFGTNQSGERSSRLGSIVAHFDILNMAVEDTQSLKEMNHEVIEIKTQELLSNKHVINTI